MVKKIELYIEDKRGFRFARLRDICNWIIETYPEDMFINNPPDVIAMRMYAKKIIKMGKYKNKN